MTFYEPLTRKYLLKWFHSLKFKLSLILVYANIVYAGSKTSWLATKYFVQLTFLCNPFILFHCPFFVPVRYISAEIIDEKINSIDGLFKDSLLQLFASLIHFPIIYFFRYKQKWGPVWWKRQQSRWRLWREYCNSGARVWFRKIASI